MEQTLLVLAAGGINVLCFFIGARIGQKVAKGETIEAPRLNPVEAVREHKEQKKERKKQERDEVILQNVDNYDGTAFGQRSVPEE